jgi:hypothetical protein
MADVNIQQSPQPVDTSGGSGAVWAIVALILLAVIAWFIFGGPMHRTHTTINVNTSGTAAVPSASPNSAATNPPAANASAPSTAAPGSPPPAATASPAGTGRPPA